MGSNRSTVFGRQPWINTIIGGVASFISSKSALATKLAISESTIKRFEIVGSDVRAHISASYTIPENCFLNNTSITSYIDYHNKVITAGLSAFQNSTIQNALIENAVLNLSVFDNCVNLTNYSFGFTFKTISSFSTSNVFRNTRIKYFKADNLTSLGGSFFSGNTELLEIIAPLTSLNSAALDGCTKLISVPDSIITMVTSSMRNCRAMTTLYFPVLTAINANTFNGCSSVLTVNLPALEIITAKGAAFANMTSCTLIDMRKLKILSPADAASTTFTNLKMNCEIRVHINLATDNSGSPNATLAWVKANRSAVVKFYDDNGNYVSTL